MAHEQWLGSVELQVRKAVYGVHKALLTACLNSCRNAGQDVGTPRYVFRYNVAIEAGAP